MDVIHEAFNKGNYFPLFVSQNLGFKQARQAKRDWCISELQNVKVSKEDELRKMVVGMEESAVEDLEWQDVVAAERLAADLLVDENDEEMVPVKRETKKEVVNRPRSKVLKGDGTRSKLAAANAQDADEVENNEDSIQQKYLNRMYQIVPGCLKECFGKQASARMYQNVPDVPMDAESSEAEEEEEQDVPGDFLFKVYADKMVYMMNAETHTPLSGEEEEEEPEEEEQEVSELET